MTHKRLTHFENVSVKVDFTVLLNLAHFHVRSIFDRWQCLWKASWTRPVPTTWSFHRQCLMRALVVVEIPPVIKLSLRVLEILQAPLPQHLRLERTVQPFQFPLRLRMVWPGMAHPDA